MKFFMGLITHPLRWNFFTEIWDKISGCKVHLNNLARHVRTSAKVKFQDEHYEITWKMEILTIYTKGTQKKHVICTKHSIRAVKLNFHIFDDYFQKLKNNLENFVLKYRQYGREGLQIIFVSSTDGYCSERQ